MLIINITKGCRYISIIYLFIFGNFLIKKNISNKLFYFYKSLKVPKLSQNKKAKRKLTLSIICNSYL